MKITMHIVSMMAAVIVLLAGSVWSADRKLEDATTHRPTSVTHTAPATEAIIIKQVDSVSQVTSGVTTQPTAGEQIKWHVMAGGATRASSATHMVSGTIGQTAVSAGNSAAYMIKNGFWQNHEPSSCCSGSRGNVNMSGNIDATDLSCLVSFVLGGTFVLPCPDAANVNGIGGIDATDLSSLVSFILGGSFGLVKCP